VTNLISYPFRLTRTGAVASRDDGSEEYLAEELGQLIQTHPGERELVPTYGFTDPAFTQFDQSMLTAQVATFGPPVIIEAVESRYLSDSDQDIVVRFRPALDMIGQTFVGEELDPSNTTSAFEEFTG
jgi:hypothetical protein